MRLSNFNLSDVPLNERIDMMVKLSTLPDTEIVPIEMASIYLNRALTTIYEYTSKGILPTAKYGIDYDSDTDKPTNGGRYLSFRMSDLREFKSRTKIRMVQRGKRIISKKLSS